MRALVTGSSGFVGCQMIAPLLAQGFEVHTLGRTSVSDPRVHHHSVSLFAGRQVNAIVRDIKPTHVIHAAWYVEHSKFWSSPQNLDWVAATIDFAQMVAEEGATRFVGVGSCIEYDWSDGGAAPRREADPVAPAQLYGEAKLATFKLLQRYFSAMGVSFAWGRLFHLYGPGEAEARLIPHIVSTLRAGKPVEIKAGGLVRDYMASADAGAALAQLAGSAAEGAINIATGEGVALAQLAGEIARLMGRVNLVRTDPTFVPAHEVPKMVADVTRLTSEVGFKPQRRRDRLQDLIKIIPEPLMA